MWQPTKLLRRDARLLELGTILVVLGIIALAFLSLWYLHTEAIKRAYSTTQNLSKSVEQTIEGLIDRIDYAIQVSADEIGRQVATGQISSAGINQFLGRQQALVSNLDLLRATNAEGETIYGVGVNPEQKASLAQRDYYKRLRNDPNLGLVISEPIVGKISQRWIWLMARRINNPDGSFGGLVYGSIFIDDLVKKLESLGMAPGSVVSIRDENLAVVARTTFGSHNALTIGDRTISPVFRAALQDNPDQGVFESGAADGVKRIYSYRRNPKYGFTVFVGMSTDEAMADWAQQATTLVAFLIVFVIGLISFARYSKNARKIQKDSLTALSQTQFALDRAGIAIHWVDAETGRFLYVNQRAADMLGYSVAEMLSFKVPDLDPNFPAGDFKQITDRMFESGSAHFESALRHKDGTLIPIELVGYVFPEQDGVTGRFITFITDITLRKAHESSLIAAKEASESASRAKSRFLANMSHEIRTPMNAIIGLTHILRRDITEPSQAVKLEKISASADHLLAVINDILDLSKIEAEKVVLEKADFRLDSVMERASAIVMDRIRAKHLELIIDSESVDCVVNGDATRLSQALLNYLGNAIKFTERGTVILRCRILERSDDSVFVRFEVQDTGIGIAPDALERLFHSFEQANNSTTRNYGGTGLGLAITKRLAQLMGGDAGAESTPGLGSTFWMTAKFDLVRIASGQYVIPQLQGKRALVVDANAASRAVCAAQLAAIGLNCESVESGEDALICAMNASHANNPHEVLFINFALPGKDGIQTLAELKASIPEWQAKAWLLCNEEDDTIAEKARRAGFSNVLLKPFLMPSLHGTLLKAYRHASDGMDNLASVGESPSEGPIAILKRKYGQRRVLLVEDEPINQEIARELLSEIGWQVDLVGNGQEAVTRLAKTSYDLILMDMQMPVMDGLEATRQIRQMEAGKSVPIIAMTANAFSEDRDACFSVGMNDYLTKPVEPKFLFKVLLKCAESSMVASDETGA